MYYNELIIQEKRNEEESKSKFIFKPTPLGKAILNSGILPEEGLLIYIDLTKAMNGIVLQNELHLLYLLTPVHCPEIKINWPLYHRIYKRFNSIQMDICKKIGIDESVLIQAS